MIKKKYMALKSGVLFMKGGEIAVSLHENTYGDQWFASEEQFQKQVDDGLIVEVDRLPSEE